MKADLSTLRQVSVRRRNRVPTKECETDRTNRKTAEIGGNHAESYNIAVDLLRDRYGNNKTSHYQLAYGFIL